MVSASIASLPSLQPPELSTSATIVTDSKLSYARSLAPTTAHKHIWVISGPSGCGKTSLAQYLHETFAFPFLEGDSCHTHENINKMSNGLPLADTERWDWLVFLREESLRILRTSSANESGVIVTCSALKRKYRDVLRIASYHDPSIKVHFLFLNTGADLLRDRVRARTNHYMKAHMVESQIECLEWPQIDELDILNVDASGTSGEVQQLALRAVNQVLDIYSGAQPQ